MIPKPLIVWPPVWPKRMTVLGPPGIGEGPIPQGMESGDIVLMAPVQPTPMQGLIFTAQRLTTYPDCDSAFTHIAVYLGNGTVVDSTPATDISVRDFAVATAACYIRALRLKGIGPAVQFDVCNEALQLRGKYNFVAAAADGLLANAPLPAHWKTMLAELVRAAGDGQTYYCGQFVNEAFVNATNVSVIDRKTFVPLPAAFSESALFDEVVITW